MRTILAAIACVGLAAAVALVPSDIATGQDGLPGDSDAPGLDEADADAFFEEFMADIERDKADRKACANTRDTVSKEEQYDACTRLIENAPNENDLVGSYYVNRALAPKDLEGQCQDVSRGVAIIEGFQSNVFRGAFLAGAKRLKDAACR